MMPSLWTEIHKSLIIQTYGSDLHKIKKDLEFALCLKYYFKNRNIYQLKF